MNGAAFGLAVIIIMLALVAGLAFAGNDLFNPTTSAANAAATALAAQSQAQKEAVDLEAYRAEKSNQADKAAFDLEVYKATRQLEVQARQRELDLNLEFARQFRQTALLVGASVILILNLVGAYCLVQINRSRLAPVQTQVQAPVQTQVAYLDPWQDPDWRALQIRRARAIETAERGTASAWRAAHKLNLSGDGDHSRAEPGRITRLPVAHDRPAQTASAN
jgi:hypothetical protein